MSDASRPDRTRRIGRDRRTAERHPSDALISLHPLAQSRNQSLAALIRDISTRGLSLLITQRFAPGTVLSLELAELASGSAPVVARVVHVARREDGKWVVGCALQKDLTAAQLRACRVEHDSGAWVGVACVPEENW
jgi:hypothetical protein